VAIGRSLGLETVAEGIESDEQARLLEATGCRFGQGYLYARPMTATEAEAFLHSLTGVGPLHSHSHPGA
jgi:EAL domain-containing protein (putative c-di-GMP-specific phosphodiesterase class I)